MKGESSAYDPDYNDYFDSPSHLGSPERRLLAAILERAVLDYHGNDKRQASAAEEWLTEWQQDDTENNHEQFTFPWVCEQLELQPKDTTNMIINKKRNRKTPQPHLYK